MILKKPVTLRSMAENRSLCILMTLYFHSRNENVACHAHNKMFNIDYGAYSIHHMFIWTLKGKQLHYVLWDIGLWCTSTVQGYFKHVGTNIYH